MNINRERPITEDGNYEPHTGWYCYYTIFKGGQGYYTPHWLFDPTLKDHYTGNALAHHIMYEFHYEEMSYAEYFRVEVFENVKPPVEVIIEKMKNNSAAIDSLCKQTLNYANSIKQLYPDEEQTVQVG